MTITNIYPTPLCVVEASYIYGEANGTFRVVLRITSRNTASGFPRTLLLGDWVNRDNLDPSYYRGPSLTGLLSLA